MAGWVPGESFGCNNKCSLLFLAREIAGSSSRSTGGNDAPKTTAWAGWAAECWDDFFNWRIGEKRNEIVSRYDEFHALMLGQCSNYQCLNNSIYAIFQSDGCCALLLNYMVPCPSKLPQPPQQPSAWSAIRRHVLPILWRQREVMLLGILALIVVDIIQLEAPRLTGLAVDAIDSVPPFGSRFWPYWWASRLPCAGSGG